MHTFTTQRFLSAPPSAVFAAISQADRLARWWGPEGFANEFEVFEFRPGGRWVFTMVGPDGARYPNESVFLQMEAQRRVVISHIVAPVFELSISLEPVNGGTQVVWVQTFEDTSVARAVAHIVEPANEQNLDRLSRELGLSLRV